MLILCPQCDYNGNKSQQIKGVNQMRKFLGMPIVLFMVMMVLAGCAPKTKGGSEVKVIKLAHLYDPGVDENTKLSYSWIEGAVKQFEAENPGFKVE
jgi:ABC-type glycerol-3-phosphate transport system substrate-binding protein